MKKYENMIEAEELRNLCIKNDWFTSGDNEQYSRLFSLLRTGASVDTLAAVIWTCSSFSDLNDIKEQLQTLSVWPIHIDYLDNRLEACGWGEVERKIIREALETHPDMGNAYKLIYTE